MQVGEALDRIGEGLFIDLGVFRPDPVPDGAVGNGGKFETHGQLPIVDAVDRPARAVRQPMWLLATAAGRTPCCVEQTLGLLSLEPLLSS